MTRKVYEGEILNGRSARAESGADAMMGPALVALAPTVMNTLESVVTTVVTAQREVEMLEAQSRAELAKIGLDAEAAADIRQKEADVVRQKVDNYTQLAQHAMREGTPEQFEAVLKELREVGS